MKEDTWLFLPLLKYYLVMILCFGFKPYKIDSMYFAIILHILQLIKHICYRDSKSFEKNIQI